MAVTTLDSIKTAETAFMSNGAHTSWQLCLAGMGAFIFCINRFFNSNGD